jgi:Endonuclease-reverse transcriptase
MVRNSVSNLFQLNTHKSRLSLSTLIDEKFNENNNVALIQEPPLNRKGEVTGYPFPLSCLYSTNYPRAAIVHNPSLEIWQLPQLSDRDCQTAIWRNGKQKPIIIISAYWDINYPEVPINIDKAISEARKMKYDVILGIDSNAHHPLWGSPVANQRGEILENFLNKVNLRTLNDGNATFKRINCETHIDITAITPSLNYKIKSWSVVEEEMFSDHLCLHTVLNPTAKYKRKILNHKKRTGISIGQF